jgi:glycosyltransferase involved in cell wall biosynthesis
MRVLHAVPAYYPSQGGIETLVRSTVRRLRATCGVASSILAPSYRFAVDTAEDPQGPWVESVDGVPVLRLPVPAEPKELGPRETLRLFSSCRKVVEKFVPDLVHSHGITLLTVPLSITATRLGCPLLWHVHGGLPENCPAALLQLLRDTPHLAACSRFVRDDIARASGRTLPTRVIYNGIDLEECDSLVDAAPHAERSDVVMVGRLEREKGFDVGLTALTPLLRAHGLRLRILGIGPELRHLRALAESLGVRDHVRFDGALPHPESLAAMARARVVVVPSTKIEGFGLVAAEAGALGVPVVASRIGGLPEVILDDETGQIVEGGEPLALRAAVLRYLADPALAEKHGQVARDHVRDRFGLATFVASLVAVYRRILG